MAVSAHGLHHQLVPCGFFWVLGLRRRKTFHLPTLGVSKPLGRFCQRRRFARYAIELPTRRELRNRLAEFAPAAARSASTSHTRKSAQKHPTEFRHLRPVPFPKSRAGYHAPIAVSYQPSLAGAQNEFDGACHECCPADCCRFRFQSRIGHLSIRPSSCAGSSDCKCSAPTTIRTSSICAAISFMASSSFKRSKIGWSAMRRAVFTSERVAAVSSRREITLAAAAFSAS